MKIEVEVRNVYGNKMIYPANHWARLASKLTGKQTLSVSDLVILKGLGHEVVEVNPNKLEL